MVRARTTILRKLRRIRNRDGVILALSTSVLLFAGELTNPVLRAVVEQYVGAQPNVALKVGALLLVFLAFTSAFGSFLGLVAAILFGRNAVPRGRFFLGFGIGLSLVGLLSKVAAAALVGDWNFIVWLAETVTGLGVLCGVATQLVMGHHAMELKKRWRKLRKLRKRHEASQRSRERRRHPMLPDH